jgi:hypothetical protein
MQWCEESNVAEPDCRLLLQPMLMLVQLQSLYLIRHTAFLSLKLPLSRTQFLEFQVTLRLTLPLTLPLALFFQLPFPFPVPLPFQLPFPLQPAGLLHMQRMLVAQETTHTV